MQIDGRMTEGAGMTDRQEPLTPEEEAAHSALPLHLRGVTPARAFHLTDRSDFDWLAEYFSGYHGVPGLRAARREAADTSGLRARLIVAMAAVLRDWLPEVGSTDRASISAALADAALSQEPTPDERPLDVERIFDVLVAEAGADERMRDEFTDFYLNRHTDHVGEFRFQGSLGFGGKVWYRHFDRPQWSVSCYPEDETPERLAIITRTNAALARLSAAGK